MTKNKKYSVYVTQSLLSSWLWVFKKDDGFEEFIDTLNKIRTPQNANMLRGIKYEEESYKGNTGAYEYVKGGTGQLIGMKWCEIQDTNTLLYGILDSLKGGVIYDIKSKASDSKYNRPAYNTSVQAPMYLEIFKNATKFTYLISTAQKKSNESLEEYLDRDHIYTETYYRRDFEPIQVTIDDFYTWLKLNNLWDTFIENWSSKKKRGERK